MKIAFFTDSYYPMLNGVTVSVANYAAELRALGHTVYIFAPKFDHYQDKEKDVYRLKALKVISTEPAVHMPFLLPHQYLTELQPRDFDIVHAHGNGFFSLLGYQMAKMKGVPFVMTFHTEMTKYMHYIFNGKLITPKMAATGLKISANVCDRVISPSEKMRRELLSYGVDKPINVVPNFVYPEKFTSTEKGFLHKKCSIPEYDQVLLSVGRLGKEKNFTFLLRAFKKVTDSNANCHLVIVGGGEEAESIKQYSKDLHLSEKVHFTGKIEQKDIAKAYADADIFVFASRTETQGVVILEAAASGLPFVVVKDGAYQNAIIDNQNGYQVPLNVTTFAQKVLELLNDKKKREEFGKRSQQIVQDNFSPSVLAQEMINAYEETLFARKPRRISFKRLNTAALRRLYKTTEILDKIFE